MNFSSCNAHSQLNKKRLLYFLLSPSRLSISFSADFILNSTTRWSYVTVISRLNSPICLTIYPELVFEYLDSSLCYILTLDRAVNQRCTCVNKWKKKRKQVGVMKEYRQTTAAVELVDDRKATQLADWERPAESCCP